MGLAEALRHVTEGLDLTAAQAAAALDDFLDNDVDPTVVAGLLIGLRVKGETAEELAGLADSMRRRAVPVLPRATGLVDTCGTGGSGAGLFNVSTAAAFVVAGAGVPVAKHGNRGYTRASGSADVLEALGVRLDRGAEEIAACIDDVGIGFLFAQALHPAMGKIVPIRKALGVRTAFNVLGPLLNPALPAYQVIGVGSVHLAEVVADALRHSAVQRAFVVHGAGGADELTLSGDNLMLRVEGGRVVTGSVNCADVGLPAAANESLVGGTPAENAVAMRELFGGKPGPLRDVVVFNASAAFLAAGRVQDMAEGVALAQKTIEAGAALATLDRLVAHA